MKDKILKAIVEFNKSMDKTTKSRLFQSGGGRICQFCTKTKHSELIVPMDYKGLTVFIRNKWLCICPDCLQAHLDRLVEEKVEQDIIKMMVNDYKAKLIEDDKKKPKKTDKKSKS